MIRTLIVDDEDDCRDTLSIFLNSFCSNVEIIGEAKSISDAYERVVSLKPDLLLLDISMPPSDGFTLLKKLPEIPFEVIFTTAFDKYALEAIKVSAIDYLLKPIDPVELQKAITKVQNKLDVLKKGQKKPKKIIIASERSYLMIDPSEIIRISLVDKKTSVVLKNKKPLDTGKTLNHFEEILEGTSFFRSHRSHIINLDEVEEYVYSKYGGCVVMSDSKLIPIAEGRKDEFLNLFNDF